MSIRPFRDISRHPTRQIGVGPVAVGGDALITVQSMTNTATTDVEGTIAQVRELEQAGVDIVRISCPDEDSTRALAEIIGAVTVPIVADIHFHYRRAIEAAEAGAACLRINPGNIGSMDRVREVIAAARDHGCSMRIGVNAGSLERDLLEKYAEPCPEALVESALRHIHVLEDNDFLDFKVSVKASDVFLAVAAYRGLAKVCDYPLHLGITEAGGLRTGTVKSAIGLGMLLWEGIGDTIRVSLAADPVEEVHAGFEILKALNLRHKGVTIIACPSCARQQFEVIETVARLEERLAHVTTPMTISIIGCVVNGPGEARETDIGLTGGGNGTHLVYMAGVADHKTGTADMIEHIVELVERRAAEIEAEIEAAAQADDEKSPADGGRALPGKAGVTG
ncbi:MAG: flavodoxin-dependent (E)-4-hydroxy-3-methylbut-2-enyl-diphosphate synthase [Alphaproteobacteria bacterium]|nr:MAG: flavodoxin-dependent (E)-4-hydroxy-3-methylbut-2-enyl-diphosphate synthase [Alphaproteobacteria bacterium]